MERLPLYRNSHCGSPLGTLARTAAVSTSKKDRLTRRCESPLGTAMEENAGREQPSCLRLPPTSLYFRNVRNPPWSMTSVYGLENIRVRASEFSQRTAGS